MSKNAVIVIDLQRDYYPGGAFPLSGIELATQRTAEVLQSARRNNSPIWHVRHIELDPAATFFKADSPGIEIHDSVKPLQRETLITKHFPNCFRDTPLEQQLRDNGITTLVFCGAMSNMCIDASVRAAFDLGFECIVIHDACAASDMEFNGTALDAQQVHTAFMGALASAYAQVTDSASFIS